MTQYKGSQFSTPKIICQNYRISEIQPSLHENPNHSLSSQPIPEDHN